MLRHVSPYLQDILPTAEQHSFHSVFFGENPVSDLSLHMLRAVVGLRSCLHVDAVKHHPDSGNHGVELLPLGLRLQLQHVELALGPLMIFCKHQEDLSSD